MLNLLTAAEDELMRVGAAFLTKFAYAGSRSPSRQSSPLKTLNSPYFAKNSAASFFELEAPIRDMTYRLPSKTLPLL